MPNAGLQFFLHSICVYSKCSEPVGWGGRRLRGSQEATYPPPPAPPQGAFGQQFSAKGAAPRHPWALKARGAPWHQRCPKENFVHFAPQHYPYTLP